ncbi:zinc-ribbon domain-containing protein [Blautia sp.]|uniref:Double zinc ribbon n=1 Tax=Blautia glucerasea TaxID=536633 RepID=A0A6N2UF69_9FIRM|nr:zinc-ribbon domain-containing protein [uncultured Blautia sp.]
MAKDFFDSIGKSLAKTMREVGGRAENFYSEQKLKGNISGEEKQIQKIMEELGKIVYRRYCDGAPLEDMQKRLCEQIDQRMERIAQFKEEIAGVKSKKICSSCGTAVEEGMAFCPHCGTACTTKEKEEYAGDVVADSGAEQIVSEISPEIVGETTPEPEEALEEVKEAVEESSEEAVEEAGEEVEEIKETAEEPTEEVVEEVEETVEELTEYSAEKEKTTGFGMEAFLKEARKEKEEAEKAQEISE